jgi:hypothetical protein
MERREDLDVLGWFGARGRSGVMRIERSAASPSPGEAGRAGVPTWRGLPHCPQNLKVGGFSNPQWEQRPAKGAAQLPQNFMPSGFSNPHFEQDCTLQIYLDFPATINRCQIVSRARFVEGVVNRRDRRSGWNVAKASCFVVSAGESRDHQACCPHFGQTSAVEAISC